MSTETLSSSDEILHLRREVEALRQTNRHLHRKLSTYVSKSLKYDRLHDDHLRMKQRIGFTLSFIRFIRQGHFTLENTQHIRPAVKSNFIRNILELTCHEITDYQELELIFTTAPTTDTSILFDHLRLYLLFCLSGKNDDRPQFEGFKLIKISSSSKIHIDCMFQYRNDIMSVRIHQYHSDIGLFSTHALVTSPIGITTVRTDIDFYDALESIYLKQVYIPHSLRSLQDNAFPKHTSLSFELKSKYLREMYQLIGSKLFYLLEHNYQLAGEGPVYRMEEEVDCPITGTTPPYPVYRLTCGHEISTIAYKGMIQTPNHFTEALRCPFCRANLEVLFQMYPIRQTCIEAIKIHTPLADAKQE
jgi:hypothetical protein